MASRRVVMLAMPCNEVIEVGGVLDVFYLANDRLAEGGAAGSGYAVEVVSPGEAIAARARAESDVFLTDVSRSPRTVGREVTIIG